MRLELHCHSLHSDGSETPAAVARAATAAGVELFCLTDHDAWAGHDEAAAAAGAGVRVLRGAELTATALGRTVHLLAYGLEPGPALDDLGRRLAALGLERRARIVAICARLAARGIRLDAAEIVARAGHGSPGRPHVAAALVTTGVCRSPREAFTRFLHDGGPADVPAPRLPLDEAVAAARAAGARLSLAHPHLVGRPAVVRELLVRFRPLGLDGIEADYGPYAARVRAGWRGLADELGLVVTAGSDYHGPDRLPTVARPGVSLDEPWAGRLRRWLGIEP